MVPSLSLVLIVEPITATLYYSGGIDMKKTALCVVITVLALCVGTAGALAAGQESGGETLAAERTSYSGGWRWGHMD